MLSSVVEVSGRDSAQCDATQCDVLRGRWSLQCLVSAHNVLNWFTRDSFRETSMLHLFTHTYLYVLTHTCTHVRAYRSLLPVCRDRSAFAGVRLVKANINVFTEYKNAPRRNERSSIYVMRLIPGFIDFI